MITILLSIGFVGALAAYATYRVMPASKYLYANAKASARSSAFLTTDELSKMCEATSFNSFLTYLKETAYADCCNVTNAKELHILMEKKFLSELQDLSKDTPSEFRRVADAYIMRFEAKILKLLIKSKMKDMEIPDYAVYPIGSLTASRIDEMKNARTIADLAVAIQRTNFSGLFAKALPESWEEAEEEIDRFVERTFYSRVKEAKIPFASKLIDAWREKVKAEAALTAIRARLRGIKTERIEELLKFLGFPDLIEIATLPIGDIAKIRTLPYKEVFEKNWSKILEKKEFGRIEIEIDKEFEDKIKRLASIYPDGPLPIFEYLTRKNNERKRIQIIGKLIEVGVPAKEIKELVE